MGYQKGHSGYWTGKKKGPLTPEWRDNVSKGRTRNKVIINGLTERLKERDEVITGYKRTINGLKKRIEEYEEEIRRLQGQTILGGEKGA